MSDIFWTEEKIKLLKEYHAKEYSFAQIAKRIGATRSQVAGKLNRIIKKPKFVKKSNVIEICMWVNKDGSLCDKPIAKHKSFCEEHCQIAYQKPKKFDIDYYSKTYFD